MRSRWFYAGATAVTIALGLGSRAIAMPKEVGDALYATMAFWIVAALAPRAPAWRIAAAALAWCFAVELAQLYRAPWIERVRATLPGRLVLGQGFHALDLACYVVGVAVAVAVDRTLRRAKPID